VNNFNFTSSEIRDMEDYALSTPQQIGNVVYMSRALVDKEEDFETYFLNPLELPSFIASKRVSSTNEVNKTDAQWNVNVFPNPSKNNFFIDLMNNEEMDINIAVYDVIGKQIEVKQLLKAKGVINFNHELADGIYLIRITNLLSEEVKSVKLIISK